MEEGNIPVTLQGGIDDAQGGLCLLLHGLQKRGFSLVVQEDGDAPGEAGADGEDAGMVVVVQGRQLVMAHCG